jgi:hypothetical protein
MTSFVVTKDTLFSKQDIINSYDILLSLQSNYTKGLN